MAARYFTDDHIRDLAKGRREVTTQFRDLREKFLVRNNATERGGEFIKHGFCRRLGTIVRSIDQVFEHLPPETEKIPERDEVVDATIAIQSFVMNCFGCLDNLAWIWVYEKDVRNPDGTELNPLNVGLAKKNKTVRNTFSKGFVDYLDSRQDWVDYLKGFRDALAHRIPLYIPPFIVDPKTVGEYNRLDAEAIEALRAHDFEGYDKLRAEQQGYGFFRPWMTHSQTEDAPAVVFHEQLLRDYVTIDEMGRTMLDELNR
jgi:hypothetical protein